MHGEGTVTQTETQADENPTYRTNNILLSLFIGQTSALGRLWQGFLMGIYLEEAHIKVVYIINTGKLGSSI